MRALALALVAVAGCSSGFDANDPDFACGDYPGRTCLQYELFYCSGESPGSKIDQLVFTDHSIPPFFAGGMARTPSQPQEYDLQQGGLVVALVPDRAWGGANVFFDVQPFYLGQPVGFAPSVMVAVTSGQHVAVNPRTCLEPPHR